MGMPARRGSRRLCSHARSRIVYEELEKLDSAEHTWPMSEIAPGIHRIEEDLGARFMAQYVLVGGEPHGARRTRVSPETLDTAIAPCLEARSACGGRAPTTVVVSHAECRTDNGLNQATARALVAHARVVRRRRQGLDRVQRPHARRELPLSRALRILPLGDEALGWLQRELGGPVG